MNIHLVTDRPQPFAARVLRVFPRIEDARFQLTYEADGRPPASLHLDFRAVGGVLTKPVVDLLTVAGTIYLASLCLAESVEVKATLQAGMFDDLQRVTEMLYDIRRWKDGLPLGPLPQISVARDEAPGRHLSSELDPATALLLWSGGKDSTLSYLTLLRNGYHVSPIHITANVGVEEEEQRALDRLAGALEVKTPEVVQLDHQDFLSFTNEYAIHWDEFPLSNRVPFGRDLFLAAAAVPVAIARGARSISMGHDNECRTAEVTHQGKRIPRNDLESAEGAVLLEQVMRKYVHPSLSLLPPIANLSELRILHDMFSTHGELMKMSSFCFWGDRCGRCYKCLRYYLADRVYGDGQLTFRANPLSAGACPELDDLLDPAPLSTLFREEVLLLLGRLASRNDDRAGEDELDRFRAAHLGRVAPHLDRWETKLLARRRDPQVPDGFLPAVDDPVLASA